MPQKGNSKGRELIGGGLERGRPETGLPSAKATAKAAAILERRMKAFDLKAAGANYEQIGKQLGVSNKTAFYDVQHAAAAHDEHMRQTAVRWVEIEMRGLERTRLKLNSAIDRARKPQEISALANALARQQERVSKLLGLDAAQRVEVSGPNGEPVRVVTYDGTPTEELLARVDQLREALINAPGPSRNDDREPPKGLLPAEDEESRYAALVAKRVGGNGNGGKP